MVSALTSYKNKSLRWGINLLFFCIFFFERIFLENIYTEKSQMLSFPIKCIENFLSPLFQVKKPVSQWIHAEMNKIKNLDVERYNISFVYKLLTSIF